MRTSCEALKPNFARCIPLPFKRRSIFYCLSNPPLLVLFITFSMHFIIGVHRLNNRRADEIEIIEH